MTFDDSILDKVAGKGLLSRFLFLYVQNYTLLAICLVHVFVILISSTFGLRELRAFVLKVPAPGHCLYFTFENYGAKCLMQIRYAHACHVHHHHHVIMTYSILMGLVSYSFVFGIENLYCRNVAKTSLNVMLCGHSSNTKLTISIAI